MSPNLRTRGERGTELVEFSLILLPLLGISFMIIDIAWVFFAQSTLQYAVQCGTRFAVTGRTGSKGQDAAIKDIVQNAAFGFLPGQAGRDKISIIYYSPSSLSQVNGLGSNAGGNVVEVSVSKVTVFSLVPLLHLDSPSTNLSASSTDVMESSPTTGPPLR